MDQENLRENTVSTHTLRTYAWKYFQKYLLLLPRVHKEEGEILERELKNKTKKWNNRKLSREICKWNEFREKTNGKDVYISYISLQMFLYYIILSK